jgi:prepilin-type N-terminal cleavage/methylation domain-containing protein
MGRKQRTGFTLVELLVVIAIIGILVALLLPAVQAAREAARRMQCGNNQKQFGLAMHNYHDVYKKFPYGVLRFDNTAAGGNVDSWASSQITWIGRLLPYLEQQPLYDRINFSLHPGTGNTAVINQELPFVRCPSDRRIKAINSRAPTNYVGCIGHIDQPNFSSGKPNQGMMLIFQTNVMASG